MSGDEFNGKNLTPTDGSIVDDRAFRNLVAILIWDPRKRDELCDADPDDLCDSILAQFAATRKVGAEAA